MAKEIKSVEVNMKVVGSENFETMLKFENTDISTVLNLQELLLSALLTAIKQQKEGKI